MHKLTLLSSFLVGMPQEWTAGRPFHIEGKGSSCLSVGLTAQKFICRVWACAHDTPCARHARQALPFDFTAWQEACQNIFLETLANLFES